MLGAFLEKTPDPYHCLSAQCPRSGRDRFLLCRSGREETRGRGEDLVPQEVRERRYCAMRAEQPGKETRRCGQEELRKEVLQGLCGRALNA